MNFYLHRVNQLTEDKIKIINTYNVGIELDLRDNGKEIIVAHDIGEQNSIRFVDFLEEYKKKITCHVKLALNIKSCELALPLNEILKTFEIKDYFVFDLSLPDMIKYLALDMKVFSRQSEYEQEPLLYQECHGLWLDEFKSHWINEEVLFKHLQNNKKIAIVSPDLHKRDYQKEWNNYKNFSKKHNSENLSICSKLADEWFNIK